MLRLLVLVILATGLSFGGSRVAAEPAPRPNVLFILSDDQRADTIAALGNPEIRTPNLDRLAERGFHFTNAYCMGSMIGAVCTPSRTMIATGRSLWRIPNPNQTEAPPGTPILARAFREAGYATFHCGKRGNSCRFGNAAFEVNIETTDNDDPERVRRMADRAAEFLENHDDARPFFMVLAPAVPHDPRIAPEEFMKMYDPAKLSLSSNFMPEHPFDNGELDVRDEKLAARPRDPEEMRQHLAGYYAMITHLDAEIGRTLEAVERRGWMENTIVVFTSDQGLAVGGRHGLMGKQNLYEHVKPPLVFAGPGVPKGSSPALAYLFDILPTLCDLTGVAIPEGVEGRSLAPVIKGQANGVRDRLFGAYIRCQRMARDERWKLIEYFAGGARNTQLFDLANDPHELNNLANDAAHAAELARMRTLLDEERERWGDPLTTSLSE